MNIITFRLSLLCAHPVIPTITIWFNILLFKFQSFSLQFSISNFIQARRASVARAPVTSGFSCIECLDQPLGAQWLSADFGPSIDLDSTN